MRARAAPAALALTGLLASATAGAEHLPLWELGAGAAALRLPDYRGSDQSRGYLLPYPYLIYRGERWRVTEEGLRGLLYRGERSALDLSLGASIPVSSDQSDARAGMPDLDPTIEIGPKLQLMLTPGDAAGGRWTLELPLRAVYATDFERSRHVGWLFNPHLEYSRRIVAPAGRWRVAASLGPLWASGEYHDYYYSVAAPFATPARPAFAAPGGYSGSRLLVTVSKRFGDDWLLGGFARYDYLGGAAFEASPLLRRDHSFMAGIALTRILARSAKRVHHD